MSLSILTSLLLALACLLLLCLPSAFSAKPSSNSFYSHLLRTRGSSLTTPLPSPPPPSHRYTSPSLSPSSPFASNSSYVDVYSYGAIGDGSTDNTQPFQLAIDAVAHQGGGTVVIPRGYFLFAGSLTVPQGVTLEGTYAAVPSHPMAGSASMPRITGSLLLPTGGRGNETATPFITLQRDATLKGVVIYYPTQAITSLPLPFPWTVDLTSDNAAVMDVECLNCYNFVRAVGAARHYIARLQGQPINIGVFVDETYDIGRIENVHFNPWYSVHPAFMAWQLTHGRSFVLARSDWEYVLNCFSFGYALGFHFIKSPAGSCNGNFLGIGVDMAVNASVQVDSADAWGILITNGEFTAFLDPTFGNTTAPSTQLVVSPSNTGAVRIVNTAFWGPSQRIARIEGSGSVGFGDCIFNQWDAGKRGYAAIAINGTGSLSVRGSEFQQSGAQIEMGGQVRRAVVVGNMFTGAERIVGKAKSMQVGLNAADE